MNTQIETVQKTVKEWSGYKIATIVVSIISVLIIGTQAFYNYYYNRRWQQINYLNEQLKQKKSEKSENDRIPKLSVFVNTLEKASLSKEMISRIQWYPSTIEIKHVGGETALGINIEIISNVPIKEFYKWTSTEPFSVRRELGNHDNSVLRLTIPSMRKGANLGITILTTSLPTIKTSMVADKAELMSENELPLITYDILKDADPYIIKSLLSRQTDPLDAQILLIQRKIDILQDESIIAGLTTNPLTMVYLLFVIMILLGAYMFVKGIPSDFRKRRKFLQTIQMIHENQFSLGTNYKTICQSLGSPDKVSVLETANTPILEFAYFSSFESFFNTKGLRFRFKDEKLYLIVGKNDEVILSKLVESTSSSSNKNVK